MKFNSVRQIIFSWVSLIWITLLVVIVAMSGFRSPTEAASIIGTPSFMPVVMRQLTPTPVPTATPTVQPTPTVPPVPQFVTNIGTSNAKCPGAAGFQPLNGYVYVLNDYSSNVNVFHNRDWVGTVGIPPTDPNDPAGSWPVAVAADNNSTDVYVAAVHAGTARINEVTRTGMGERYYEPHGVVINPINNLVYVSDLDRAVQVFDNSTLLENIVFSMPPNADAWFLDIVVDPNTGYIYTAGSEGLMYVIDGTTVIGSYRLGYRVVDLEIDPVRGYIYAAHNEKNAVYNNNISVFNINTQTVTMINTASRSRGIAIDPNTGLTYITNPGPDDDPNKDSVTLLLNGVVQDKITVGDLPWGVAVNPNTGYAFVTNRQDGTVTVLRDGDFITTIPVQGVNPFAVTVDTLTNDVYVANRGIEHSVPLFDCEDASVTILN